MTVVLNSVVSGLADAIEKYGDKLNENSDNPASKFFVVGGSIYVGNKLMNMFEKRGIDVTGVLGDQVALLRQLHLIPLVVTIRDKMEKVHFHHEVNSLDICGPVRPDS